MLQELLVIGRHASRDWGHRLETRYIKLLDITVLQPFYKSHGPSSLKLICATFDISLKKIHYKKKTNIKI